MLLLFFIPLCFFMILVIIRMTMPVQSARFLKYLNFCLEEEADE